MTQLPHIDVDALNAYLDDAVPDAERRTIASHLTSCAHCRRELAELRTTVSLLHRLPQYQPRRSFQLGAEHARRPRRLSVRLLPVIRPLAMAAVVLFAVVTGVAYLRADPSTDLDRALEPQMAAPAERTDTQQGTTPTPQTSLMTEATSEADDADILGDAALDQEASTANQEGAAPQAAVEESRAMAESEDAAPTGTAAAGQEGQADAATDGAGAALGAPAPGAGQRQVGDERIDGWSLASVGLGLVAAILLVAWAALARLSHHQGG